MSKNGGKKVICGNWKMHPLTYKEGEKLFKDVVKGLPKIRNTEVLVAVPLIYIEKLRSISKKVSLTAQNAFYGDVGAFTGEVSGAMLSALGVKYVIIGHSERRALGEDNSIINKKLKSVLAEGVVPILCVGEEERDESHNYFELVRTQVKECLSGINKNLIPKIIIAYEPVWALSSTPNRRDATAEDSNEMAIFIRKTISDMTNPAIASGVRILYGGSVNERDAEYFLTDGGVDGVMPGKASLTAKKFIAIVTIAENIK